MAGISAAVVCVTLICYTSLCSGTDDWDHFVFAQEWPVAVCEQAKEKMHNCTIPSVVHSWGIHGLWPSLKDTRGPTNCNLSKPFDFSKLKPLLNELHQFWPNMYADTNDSTFWQHEWEKHGRCATTLPATADEYMYFKQSLQLIKQFDASILLKNKRILPSNVTMYTLAQIQNALKKQLGNKNVVIECTKDLATGKDMLYEVEICMNKQFQPIDCYTERDWELDNTLNSHFYRKHRDNKPGNCPRDKNTFEYKPIPKH